MEKYEGCSPESELSQLKKWISILRETDSEPFFLEDLDEEILRVRLLPPISACIWNEGREKLKREEFYKHLRKLNKKQLLEIHYKREERKERKTFTDPLKIFHIQYWRRIERRYGIKQAMLIMRA